ncbi:histidine phosphatase family protein [Arenibaculum pallidiluteum]|uniref:histidine phosphatase family protein n=1 Tax=Arenibaculum pallidiluteum TaxID=2812559 RepID=UPI001A964FA2|nr:histidine phosphatase family protein [Arenibaculum pallidiluteum]
MILLRHGESHFNRLFSRSRVDPGIHDPELTETGQAQAMAAATALSGERIESIVASPYTRALQTASIIAEVLGVPVEVDPLVGERAAMSCDIGTPTGELAIRWPHLDLSHLAETWWPDFGEPESGIARRASEFLELARARANREHMLVVSHWGFIRALTGREVHNCQIVRFDWRTLSAAPDPC